MSTTAALYMIYEEILAHIHQRRDLNEFIIAALLHLFDEMLINALYLVDRRSVTVQASDLRQLDTRLVPATVQGRHPEPPRSVLLARPTTAGETTVRHDWCECAEYALVAGGAQGMMTSSSGGAGLPLPICVHLLAGQIALRTNRIAVAGQQHDQRSRQQDLFDRLTAPLF